MKDEVQGSNIFDGLLQIDQGRSLCVYTTRTFELLLRLLCTTGTSQLTSSRHSDYSLVKERYKLNICHNWLYTGVTNPSASSGQALGSVGGGGIIAAQSALSTGCRQKFSGVATATGGRFQQLPQFRHRDQNRPLELTDQRAIMPSARPFGQGLSAGKITRP